MSKLVYNEEWKQMELYERTGHLETQFIVPPFMMDGDNLTPFMFTMFPWKSTFYLFGRYNAKTDMIQCVIAGPPHQKYKVSFSDGNSPYGWKIKKHGVTRLTMENLSKSDKVIAALITKFLAILGKESFPNYVREIIKADAFDLEDIIGIPMAMLRLSHKEGVLDAKRSCIGSWSFFGPSLPVAFCKCYLKVVVYHDSIGRIKPTVKALPLGIVEEQVVQDERIDYLYPEAPEQGGIIRLDDDKLTNQTIMAQTNVKIRKKKKRKGEKISQATSSVNSADETASDDLSLETNLSSKKESPIRISIQSSTPVDSNSSSNINSSKTSVSPDRSSRLSEAESVGKSSQNNVSKQSGSATITEKVRKVKRMKLRKKRHGAVEPKKQQHKSRSKSNKRKRVVKNKKASAKSHSPNGKMSSRHQHKASPTSRHRTISRDRDASRSTSIIVKIRKKKKRDHHGKAKIRKHKSKPVSRPIKEKKHHSSGTRSLCIDLNKIKRKRRAKSSESRSKARERELESEAIKSKRSKADSLLDDPKLKQSRNHKSKPKSPIKHRRRYHHHHSKENYRTIAKKPEREKREKKFNEKQVKSRVEKSADHEEKVLKHGHKRVVPTKRKKQRGKISQSRTGSHEFKHEDSKLTSRDERKRHAHVTISTARNRHNHSNKRLKVEPRSRSINSRTEQKRTIRRKKKLDGSEDGSNGSRNMKRDKILIKLEASPTRKKPTNQTQEQGSKSITIKLESRKNRNKKANESPISSTKSEVRKKPHTQIDSKPDNDRNNKKKAHHQEKYPDGHHSQSTTIHAKLNLKRKKRAKTPPKLPNKVAKPEPKRIITPSSRMARLTFNKRKDRMSIESKSSKSETSIQISTNDEEDNVSQEDEARSRFVSAMLKDKRKLRAAVLHKVKSRKHQNHRPKEAALV